MQLEWLQVLVRLALYLDLMLVFGLPLFGLHTLHGTEWDAPIARRYARWAAVAGMAGIVLSAFGLSVMMLAMTGVSDYGELSTDMFAAMLAGTDVGIAWMWRMAALLTGVLGAAALAGKPRRQLPWLMATGAVALATLAWSGHGAMSDGTLHAVHLMVAMAHLLAAGAWFGALVAFVMLARAARAGTAAWLLLARAAQGFAAFGTVTVATLAVTGAANYWLIAGPPSRAAATSPYGMLLLAKLAVFAGMLGMAAWNRYRLAPALAAQLAAGAPPAAGSALRRSLRTELAMAIVILAMVALLGTLSPAA